MEGSRGSAAWEFLREFLRKELSCSMAGIICGRFWCLDQQPGVWVAPLLLSPGRQCSSREDFSRCQDSDGAGWEVFPGAWGAGLAAEGG